MEQPENPPVTEEMREKARQAPGTWIYLVDPAFEGAEEVPGSAVVGAYHVDDNGEIGTEFTRNADYVPSAVAWGLPAPTNELEGALQNAATGKGGDDEVRAALLDATVFTPSAPGQPVVPVRDESLDLEVVLAFTSELYLPHSDVGRVASKVPVRDIVPELSGRYLLLNPGSRLELRIPGSDLA